MRFQALVCFSTLVVPLTLTVLYIVVLSTLPKLRRITWDNSFSLTVFEVAATQLGSISSPCESVEEVAFVACAAGEYFLERKDTFKPVDEALTSGNFPSLRRVRLYKDIPFDCFPILQSSGLLEWTRS